MAVKVLKAIHRWLALHLNFSVYLAVQVFYLLMVSVRVIGFSVLSGGLSKAGITVNLCFKCHMVFTKCLLSLGLGRQVLTKLVYLIERLVIRL